MRPDRQTDRQTHKRTDLLQYFATVTGRSNYAGLRILNELTFDGTQTTVFI